MPRSPLAALEGLRLDFGAGAAQAKRALLERLAHTRLAGAAAVRRLHELLCFLRAYPGDAAVLAQVEQLLGAFAARPDLRTHRAALAGSGIAGTTIRERFFAGQARWLAERWPAQLRLDRSDAAAEARIAQALPALLTPLEATALIELRPAGHAALDRLRGSDNDAVFLQRRIAALPGGTYVGEVFSDALDATYTLAPGPGTPSRTQAHLPFAPHSVQRALPPRTRPDLRAELSRPPRAVRRLSPRRGQLAIELARAAMVTRARSLEAFSFADARDAWLVDDGDGLAFVIVGVVPERRHALASYYGALTLRNGVPIGYQQSDHVGASAALSFNTFDTFRGGEAAFTFARWLAALHHLLAATAFSFDPYQLGHHNDEALASGAWWFYAKLGFAPRDAATRRLAAQEAARLQRQPGRRSSAATLERLSSQPLFFELDPAHPHPLVPLGALGLRAGAALSERGGADRDHALAAAGAALARLGGVSLQGLPASARAAWRRLLPLLALLDLAAWSDDDRRALVEVVRAKGGRSERDYVQRYLAHPRLGAAVLAITTQGRFPRRS